MTLKQGEKAERFRALHEGAPFLLPNPWDAGSAKVLASLGFSALASTSSGLAFTLGRRDGEVTLDEVRAHVEVVAAATDLPLSVDLENGFGSSPNAAASAVRMAAEAGAVGGSIEDYEPGAGIYPADLAAERVAAAAEAARGLDFPFTLTGRAENHSRGNPDLEDTIARLRAYERAGADVLFAPGLDTEQIRTVSASTTRPLNVLARPGMDLAEAFSAGAQRVSVGGALTWVAAQALADAGKSLLAGDLTSWRSADPGEIARLLAT